ncbi:MAG: hypothetical protein ACFFD1_00175 [Candidatus Thorarchaeota archaeon]
MFNKHNEKIIKKIDLCLSDYAFDKALSYILIPEFNHSDENKYPYKLTLSVDKCLLPNSLKINRYFQDSYPQDLLSLKIKCEDYKHPDEWHLIFHNKEVIGGLFSINDYHE